MEKRLLLLLLSLFMLAGMAVAQTHITGMVCEDGGEPCIGATVMIQRTEGTGQCHT